MKKRIKYSVVIRLIVIVVFSFVLTREYERINYVSPEDTYQDLIIQFDSVENESLNNRITSGPNQNSPSIPQTPIVTLVSTENSSSYNLRYQDIRYLPINFSVEPSPSIQDFIHHGKMIQNRPWALSKPNADYSQKVILTKN